MRTRLARPVVLLVMTSVLASCGGDGSTGEPLLGGALTGSWDGTAFEPVNGFAAPYMGGYVIGVGAGPIHCGTETASSPPSGYNAVIALSDLAVGTYGSTFVEMLKSAGGFEGVGSNNGYLEITEVTTDSVSGSISYGYTDLDGRTFTLEGTFTVYLCPS